MVSGTQVTNGEDWMQFRFAHAETFILLTSAGVDPDNFICIYIVFAEMTSLATTSFGKLNDHERGSWL